MEQDPPASIVSLPPFQSMEAPRLLLFLSIKIWHLKIPHSNCLALDESKWSIWAFYSKIKLKRIPQRRLERCSEWWIWTENGTSQGAQNILQAMGSDIRTSCACPRGSPVAVHDWRWIHASAWPLRACPTPLGDRVEKSSYWVRETVQCVSLGRHGFQTAVYGVCECVTEEIHFASPLPMRRKAKDRGWFAHVRS